jgi:rhodanese-related sulfurtransferase
MPTAVTRRQLVDLIAVGGQLVEVLPEAEYLEEHLPGAINLPLRQLSAESVAALDPARPVVVYCWDAL